MGFAERQARLQDAVFRQFGELATWPGISDPVLVISRAEDVEQQFNGATLIGEKRMVRVRESDVADPASGMVVTIIATGEQLTLTGEPELDRKRVWHCPVPA